MRSEAELFLEGVKYALDIVKATHDGTLTFKQLAEDIAVTAVFAAEARYPFEQPLTEHEVKIEGSTKRRYVNLAEGLNFESKPIEKKDDSV